MYTTAGATLKTIFSLNLYFLDSKLIAAADPKADRYKPVITTYDYDCPVSESGRTGQPGIGGPNKFNVSSTT